MPVNPFRRNSKALPAGRNSANAEAVNTQLQNATPAPTVISPEPIVAATSARVIMGPGKVTDPRGDQYAKVGLHPARTPARGVNVAEAWALLEQSPALQFAMSSLAALVLKGRLVVQDVDRETGEMTGVTENSKAAGILAYALGGPTAQGQLLADAFVQLWVTSTAYVVRDLKTNTVEIYSVEDLRVNGDLLVFTEETGWGGNTLDPKRYQVIELFRSHPRKRVLRTSAVAQAAPILRKIALLDRQIEAVIQSYLARGLLLIPDALDVTPTAPEDDMGDGAPAGILDGLAEAITASIDPKDLNTPSSLSPIILIGKQEALEAVRWVSWPMELSELVGRLKADELAALATALDVPGSLVSPAGSGSTGDLSHWSAWHEGSALAASAENQLSLIATALAHWFDEELTASGLDPADFALWYDASALYPSADPDGRIFKAVENGVLSPAAAARLLGYAPEDVPEPDAEAPRPKEGPGRPKAIGAPPQDDQAA